MENIIVKRAAELKDWIVGHRRDFHRNPELAYREIRTTAILKEELEKLGIETVSVGETGIMGILRGRSTGRTVALRGDIDALPITEESGVDFSSSQLGLMHACGHDTHTSMLLGAARILAEQRDAFEGTVKLIFQPGEEVGSGARKLTELGVLKNPDVDAIVGMHIMADFPAGTLVVQEGPLMASGDQFDLEITGDSCHGSAPWQGNDANMCVVAVIQAFQTIVSRKNDVRVPLVLNVGTIQAGERFNVTSGKAVLTGTVRTFDEHVRRQVPVWMEEILAATCAAYGCTGKLNYQYVCAAVYNDSPVTQRLQEGLTEVLHQENILKKVPLMMGSEDFSAYQEKVPGAMLFLGTRNEEKGCVYPIHSNRFKVDEDVLPIGAAVYAQSALALLK